MLGQIAALRKSAAVIKQRAGLCMEGASLAQVRHAWVGYNAHQYRSGYKFQATPDELPFYPHNHQVAIQWNSHPMVLPSMHEAATPATHLPGLCARVSEPHRL